MPIECLECDQDGIWLKKATCRDARILNAFGIGAEIRIMCPFCGGSKREKVSIEAEAAGESRTLTDDSAVDQGGEKTGMVSTPGGELWTGQGQGRSEKREANPPGSHPSLNRSVSVHACDYGVPQHRTRFICMGTRRDLVECDGVLGSLPEPVCFSQNDLEVLAAPMVTLFGEEETEHARLINHAPGVRYFPDREFLRPPHPNNNVDSDHHGRAVSHVEFYRNLLENEPDRIVTAPRHGMERAA